MHSLQEIMKIYPGMDGQSEFNIERLGLREDEYVKDENIYCKKCDTKRTTHVVLFGQNKVVRCICQCEKEKMLKEEEEKEFKEKLLRRARLQENSLMGDKYKEVRFDNTIVTHNSSFKAAYERCKKYCENSKEVIKNGYGIYLYSKPGLGKTRLMAALANELIEQYKDVIFTNFFTISKKVRNTYNGNSNESESKIINRLATVDVLIIDDLGTESLSKNDGNNFMQDLIFEVINTRYNNKKATLFTSNYSIKELFTSRGFELKTVDRISELATAVIYVDGESYRGKVNKDIQLPF